MTQPLTYLKETASQTAGPYVHIGLSPHQAGFDIFQNNFDNNLVGATTPGTQIIIEGRVFDGSGHPVRDALLEIWQANADGRYNHPGDRQKTGSVDPHFRGWGRACTDFEAGVYRFYTVKPGSAMGREGRKMAPHISFWIVSRGINMGLNTRMYFADEQEANEKDPVLSGIELKKRRDTLIAKPSQKDGKTVYTFDIVLQGEGETVFFDI
jgi:protocatechuate 3,4-dioxygenase alpha subunit